MKNARLFKKNGDVEIVSAEDVLYDKVDRNSEFVDLEYEFKACFVKDCKGHYGPYFRLYLSREDYQKLTPYKKTKYEIVKEMRRYQESIWHRYWKERFEQTCECEIEKTIKNEKSKTYKYADAYCKQTNTCIEFQHSFISMDFEERNKFYKELGIQIVWLYDLTKSSVKKTGDNEYEILEDNARGFFRIADFKDNLEKYHVYFQARDRFIYRIDQLRRKEIDDKKQSTIRLFNPLTIWTEDEFIDNVLSGNLASNLHTVDELWNKDYSAMIIEDTETGKRIKLISKKDGTMYRALDNGVLFYRYVDNTLKETKNKDYPLKRDEEHKKKWKLIKPYYRKGYLT